MWSHWGHSFKACNIQGNASTQASPLETHHKLIQNTYLKAVSHSAASNRGISLKDPTSCSWTLNDFVQSAEKLYTIAVHVLYIYTHTCIRACTHTTYWILEALKYRSRLDDRTLSAESNTHLQSRLCHFPHLNPIAILNSMSFFFNILIFYAAWLDIRSKWDSSTSLSCSAQ